jgi:hypothetical protein
MRPETSMTMGVMKPNWLIDLANCLICDFDCVRAFRLAGVNSPSGNISN